MVSYKLISWNVNGIRAALKKNFWGTVTKLDPDCLAIQETKADATVMKTDLLKHPVYNNYWHSCTSKKGYSGVVTLSKRPALSTQAGFGVEEFDQEGRVILTQFPEFTLLNIYFPNGGQGSHRVEYKINFYNQCLEYMENLRAAGHNLIISGDYNTAHQPIDLHDPENNHHTSGFLRIERDWLDKLGEYKYIDTFRYFYPESKEVYTWWDLKTRSRSRNRGWRIDYFFIAVELLTNLQDAFVLSEIEGSDHCPLGINLKF